MTVQPEFKYDIDDLIRSGELKGRSDDDGEKYSFINEVESEPVYDIPQDQTLVSPEASEDVEDEDEYNPFENIKLKPYQEKQIYDRKDKSEDNPFENIQADENWRNSLVRTLYQIPAGMMKVATFPMDLIMMLGVGDANDPEEIDRLHAAAQRQGITFDEEKYREGVYQAQRLFPTQENIERMIEEQTGAPLTPKNKIQKGLRLASQAGSLTSGTLTQRAVAAGGAEVVNEGLQAVGVPEEIAEPIGLGLGIVGGGKAPSVGYKRKPSGLPELRFESTKSPKTASKHRIRMIDYKLEKNFRKIAGEIEEASELGATKKALEAGIAFEAELSELFDKVLELSKGIEGSVPTNTITNRLRHKLKVKEGTGILASEYEKSYVRHTQMYMRDTKTKNVTAYELLDQYRDVNKGVREIYETGKSAAYNRGKIDALLDYNKAIAEVIEKEYPNSEFSKLFKETNAQYTKIKQVEALKAYIDDFFDSKIDFKQGKEYFKSEFRDRLKKALGEKEFANFDQLMKDFMEVKRARALINTAESRGYTGLRAFEGWLIKPFIGSAIAGKRIIKQMYQTLLDKPRLTLKWDKAIQAVKQENFAEAEKLFTELEKEIGVSPDEIIPPKKPTTNSKSSDSTIDAQVKKVPRTELEAPKKQLEAPKKQITLKSKQEQADFNKKQRDIAKKKADLKKKEEATKNFLARKKAKEKASPKEKKKSAKKILEEKLTPKQFKKEKDLFSDQLDKTIDKVTRPEIKPKQLKQQKAYFIDKLEKAIEKPTNAKTLTVDIPGDGTFKIVNRPEVLKSVLEKVKKKYPTSVQNTARKKKNLPKPKRDQNTFKF